MNYFGTSMKLEGEGRPPPIQISSGNEGCKVLLACLVWQTGFHASWTGKMVRQTGSLAGRLGDGRLSRRCQPGAKQKPPVVTRLLTWRLPAGSVPRPADRTPCQLVRLRAWQTGRSVHFAELAS